MSKYQFDVTVVTDEGGPDPELLTRFATVLTYRLELLDERDGAEPAGSGRVTVTARIPV